MMWTHTGTAMLAAFLGSLVEFVEALTIVLAVGTIRGWRSALSGVAMGLLLLTLLVVTGGPALEQVSLTILQLIIGILLLLFGLRWLRKAILRAAGVIQLHDEAVIYMRETEALEHDVPVHTAHPQFDIVAIMTAFKAVTLEGLEVVFIVIAIGAGGMLGPASLGAAIAGLLVVAVGIVLRRPLARVPENMLKFAVGILLSAFGVFWVGEGLRFPWFGGDVALLGLVVGFLAVAALAIRAVRSLRHDDSFMLSGSAS